jgi:hypothetical protein
MAELLPRFTRGSDESRGIALATCRSDNLGPVPSYFYDSIVSMN